MEFPDVLRKNIDGYQGKHANIIKHAPELFELLSKLTLSNEIELKFKRMLYVTIGYFVIPNDLYSEDTFGPIGYIDDILISIHVLKEIANECEREVIYEEWEGDLDVLDELIDTQLPILAAEYSEMYDKLRSYLRYAS